MKCTVSIPCDKRNDIKAEENKAFSNTQIRDFQQVFIRMTGQHNSLTNYCLQTILAILILHTAAISCAPLKCRNFSYDVIVDEGTQFLQDIIIPSVYPQPIDQVHALYSYTLNVYNISISVCVYIQELERCTAPNLTEAVCPLFEEYSRLSVTLENLSENDSLHTNLSLLVLVTRKVLIDFCKLKVS